MVLVLKEIAVASFVGISNGVEWWSVKVLVEVPESCWRSVALLAWRGCGHRCTRCKRQLNHMRPWPSLHSYKRCLERAYEDKYRSTLPRAHCSHRREEDHDHEEELVLTLLPSQSRLLKGTYVRNIPLKVAEH